MSSASLAQWLERLETLHPRAMELGLERVSTVAQRLHLLPLPGRVITIAGTNGKGSTAAALESLLRQSDHTVGCFTSPHFLRFNERIRVDGAEVADEEIVAAFEEIEQARGQVSLTYFEFATLAALLVFGRRAVDYCVLEVGLGGRLDSVNIVDTDVAVITSIDLDHQEWLGESREQIALEKAGIARAGRPAVIGEPDPPPSLMQYLGELGAGPLYWLGDDFTVEYLPGGWSGRVAATGGVARPLPLLEAVELLPVNACIALQTCEVLGVDLDDDAIGPALAAIDLTGRRQLQELQGREYLLDVGHNPAAIDKLLEYIDVTPCNGRTIALFSAMSDKDVAGMLQRAHGHFDAWFLADQPDNPRALSAADTAELLREQGQGMVSVSKNIRQAFRRAQGLMAEGDRLVVFGSFFTVAGVLPALEKDRRKNGAC